MFLKDSITIYKIKLLPIIRSIFHSSSLTGRVNQKVQQLFITIFKRKKVMMFSTVLFTIPFLFLKKITFDL